MKTPLISVLMSTYNTPNEWLCEAIDSVLSQTQPDFEFLIIDDCSTTDLTPVIKKYHDNRIKWLRNDVNLGLTKSLNKLLKMAKGKYIARMDADDVCMPRRFEVQIKYMEEHPDIIVVGSYRRAFGKVEKAEIWKLPKTREEQQVQLFFFNCGVTHPTAMIRKSMLDEFGITYNESYRKAQDYGLWVQCTRYAPMAMIPEILLKYRKSEQQISFAGKCDQRENSARVKTDQLLAIGIDASTEEKALHIAFCVNDTTVNPERMERWVLGLKSANERMGYFDHAMFEKILDERWYLWCKKAFKEEGKVEAKKVYKNAVTIAYRLQDAKLYLKRKIARFAHR